MKYFLMDSKSSFAAEAEILRAEIHLNSESWMVRLQRGIGLTGVGILVALATLMLSASQVWASKCPVNLKAVTYSASFEILNPETGKNEKRRLIVGHARPSENGPFTAQIWSGNSCQASCRGLQFEKESPYSPIALRMTCHSTQLTSLSNEVTLLWGRGRSLSKVPTLRFGTWLQGYTQAVLRVEYDHLSAPHKTLSKRLAYRSPSQLPTRNMGSAVAAR